MYSQVFSADNLYLCSTQSERRNIGLCKDDFIQRIESCIGKKKDLGSYQFKYRKLQDLYVNDWPKGSKEYLCQDLIMRKLYNNIKRIYGINQSNRNQIVKQIQSLLQEEVSHWIVRLDIRHFYESVNSKRLLESFQEEGRLNFQSLDLLQRLFENLNGKKESGLPRGLSISSVMSERYMKKFDLEMKRIEGVFYYARFVDDIIVFCSNKQAQENVWNAVPEVLKESQLFLNYSKSYKWQSEVPNGKLTYLGYSFHVDEKHNVEISQTENKVNVIKTRITKSFVRFAKDGDFSRLKNRIKFLTGNFTIYNKRTLLPVKVGIYYNYNMLSDIKSLYDLDKYYQRILHCRRGKLGSILYLKMTEAQRRDITKYSFVFGFKNRVNHFFSSSMLADIAECWL